MALAFPNPSCDYDEQRRCVRFWGYDSAIEVLIIVEASALLKLKPELDQSKTGFLEAFRSVRETIEKAALRRHVRNAQGSYTYVLTDQDV